MAARKNDLAQIELIEAVLGSARHEIDRAKGVIKHVKVLGKNSPNKHGRKDCEGTEYSDAALNKSLGLYEGRKAYIDHPKNRNAKAERSMRDLAGTFRNCTLESDGVYADFHFPPTSANGILVADWAEHDPTAFGLSHNAVGTGRVKGKKQVIESIDHVRSVDIVCDPATTRGLFESKEKPMAIKTIREAIEELGLTKEAKTLLEMEGIGDMPADGTAEGDTPESHLANAIGAFVKSDIDAATKKKKINKILAILDEVEATEPETEPEETPAVESIEAVQTLQSEVKALRDKDQVRDLCESNEVRLTPLQFEACMSLSTEPKRKAFILEAKQAKIVVKPKSGPRSNSATSLLESKGNAPAKDKAEFLSLITG